MTSYPITWLDPVLKIRLAELAQNDPTVQDAALWPDESALLNGSMLFALNALSTHGKQSTL